jgi:pSer/pThr/pTyr-binding forkhead associated (FHA) protein
MQPLTLISLNDGKVHPCAKDFILVGRQDICDLRIDHKSVSKQHCVLVKRGETLWLRDLGSTNGSHVNGKRVRRAPLNVKDILGVAGFTFRLAYGDDRQPASADTQGTKKLSPEDIERLQHKDIATPGTQPGAGPVVRVNALPDDYTPVVDAEEHSDKS